MDADEWANKELEYKASIDTANATIEDLTKQNADAKAEIAKLQSYICKYVTSDKPSKAEDVRVEKSFNELYNETISNLGKE